MQSFDMPEFYMPYPARCNPHLEPARVHAKTWATQMGMLDSPQHGHGSDIWDERTFDSMDFALFAALVYPDAPSPELNLLTDWHVWLFYFDDHFLKTYNHNRDLASAKAYLDRLPAFIPISHPEAVPVPTNPVEAGLADLWPRTAPAMSEHWRARFSEETYNTLQEPLQELSNASDNRLPNPIEYIEMRRKTGGALWGAGLIEYAVSAEVPSEIAATRPMRVLKDTFADGINLRNDIISYQKEVLAGETNGLMVVEQFLDCNLQRAVDVVNDLATSRMQQFENTALTELPLLVAEYGLGPTALLDILRYVKGLQDCMAGELPWEKQTGRYNDTGSLRSADPAQSLLDPTGIGTAAARLGLARRVASVVWPTTSSTARGEDASRVELPEFYMPFAARCNPHLDTARTHAKAWAVEMGMLGSGQAIWDEPGFDSTDYALYAALLYPDAPSPEFNLATLWNVWGTSLDDFFDENFKLRRDLGGGKAFLSRLQAFMPISHPEALPVPTNPVERGLADLWSRTAPAMSIDWRRQLAGSIQITSEGLLWEVLNLVANRIPDAVDYFEMRRQTIGLDFQLLLMQYALSLEIPPEIFDAGPMRTLAEAWADWEGLFNDIVSYQKEADAGEINGVTVLQRFLDCDLQQAITLTNDLVTSRLRHFEHIVATVLPDFVAELGPDAVGRENIDRYVQEQQYYIAGYFQYALGSSRYGLTIGPHATPAADTPSAPALVRLPFGPTGLGTAAARIGSVHTVDGPGPVPVTAQPPALASVPTLVPPSWLPRLSASAAISSTALTELGSVPVS